MKDLINFEQDAVGEDVVSQEHSPDYFDGQSPREVFLRERNVRERTPEGKTPGDRRRDRRGKSALRERPDTLRESVPQDERGETLRESNPTCKTGTEVSELGSEEVFQEWLLCPRGRLKEAQGIV